MKYHVVTQSYEIELPDTPYSLWCSGELWEYVNAADGAKVEVIGGEIHIEGPPRRPDPQSAAATPPRLTFVIGGRPATTE
jgi:hypothetical protein